MRRFFRRFLRRVQTEPRESESRPQPLSEETDDSVPESLQPDSPQPRRPDATRSTRQHTQPRRRQQRPKPLTVHDSGPPRARREPRAGLPDWVTFPVPANSVRDESELQAVVRLCEELPDTIRDLVGRLDVHSARTTYDILANAACAGVWRALHSDAFESGEDSHWNKEWLVIFAARHFPPRAQARVLRRLCKDPHVKVRRAAERRVAALRFNEVALPVQSRRGAEGDPEAAWDKSGWQHGLERPSDNRDTNRAQERLDLPQLPTVRSLRDLLRIPTAKQLGWMLVASDAGSGPYTRFEIPKRSGSPRAICAPQWSLRCVQERILTEILYRVPVHPAAHGFVPGRSTVTNAAPHVGRRLVLKFDLVDFFPTIHHYRVVGLFTSLGYDRGDGRFSSVDHSAQVAPTLARLCMYTEKPKSFGEGALPQGAPTSPAISNLICRTLDARLQGLARASGGTYTRYADDLTFSFDDDKLTVGRFRWWVDQICHQEGFRVNHPKFRVIRSSQRQSVTGIVVNDSLRIPRRARRRFRAILHNCRKHGVDSQARGNPGFRAWLRGFASYMNMVDPEAGGRALQEVRELLDGPSAGAEGSQ